MEYFKRKKAKPENPEPEENSSPRAYENPTPKEGVEAAREALQKVLEESAKAWAEVLPKPKPKDKSNAGQKIAKRYQKHVSQEVARAPIPALRRALVLTEFIQAAKKLTGVTVSDKDIEACRTKKGWVFVCRYCGNGVAASQARHIEECREKEQLLRKLGLYGAYCIHAVPEGQVYPDIIEVVNGKVFCTICGEEIKSLNDLKVGDGRLGCRTLETLLKQKEAWRAAVANGWYAKLLNNRLRISTQQEG